MLSMPEYKNDRMTMARVTHMKLTVLTCPMRTRACVIRADSLYLKGANQSTRLLISRTQGNEFNDV